MTLEQLKDYWKEIALKHKDVRQFMVGNNYDAANNTDDKYPLVFWEMPYSIDYPDLDKQLDKVTCAMSVFLYTKQDDILDAHSAISLAKEIGDAIITRVEELNDGKDFVIDSVNAVSVREYSDDSVSGLRWDITMSVKRETCEKDVWQAFNEV